jgi:ATP synthase F1 epsilon subunit|tara:strand:+ start:264 stop:659 length:396 start_codon:yes stop_codon:yes gene_type:complete
MENSFKFEIISPEKIIFSENVKMVTLPSYEGEMSILKNHISVITFLRPGMLKIEKNDGVVLEFFIQDGTVEYFNESLVALSTSAKNKKDISKDFANRISKDTQDKLSNKEITDHDRYVLNHQLNVINELKI